MLGDLVNILTYPPFFPISSTVPRENVGIGEVVGSFQAFVSAPEDARYQKGFQHAYSGHPDLALRQLDKLLELVPQDQVGGKLRDLVNKEWAAKQGPAEKAEDGVEWHSR